MPKKSKPSVWTDDGCLEWQNARMPSGYGLHDRPEGGTRLVHRQVLEEHLGRRLEPHEQVMHSCDNPPCHNIEHLSVGTNDLNIQDRVAKGRSRNGAMNRTHCPNCGGEYVLYVSPVSGASRRRCPPCYEATQQRALARRREQNLLAGKTPRRWKGRGL